MTRLTPRPCSIVLALVLLAFARGARSDGPTTTSSAAAPAPAEHANRLAGEKSPYLLQHAHNPVDWYPWGPEAFEKARRENKPIFLSVGYATCHWCHVMERESFEDPAVASLINRYTVPVKVDRQERPDVDRAYMAFVQASTGSGGWPMTVLLTPDAKPFFGGTYFPPEARGGLPGLKDVLEKTHELWEKQHERVLATADQITQALREATSRPATSAVGGEGAGADGAGGATHRATNLVTRAAGRALIAKGYRELAGAYDATHGGFGTAPKFPEPVNLAFLLRVSAGDAPGDAPRGATDANPAAREPDAGHGIDRPRAREMALLTLRRMAAGGIHDPLGGGFHRYATDARWLRPHFEKMLYDQALLAGAYLDAYQLTGESPYADTARDTLDYVLRDLRTKDGLFASAEDADSAAGADAGAGGAGPAVGGDRREGAFYVWTADELARVLGPDRELFAYAYGITPAGNLAEEARADPRHEWVGQNVLALAHGPADTAAHFARPVDAVETILVGCRRKLLEARARRPRPRLDDQVLAGWNGLTIGTLARAGVILDDPRYAAAATAAAAFVQARLYDPEGHALRRRWRDGRADVGGFLDDYAFLIAGVLDLYEATLDVRWLKWAADLQAGQDDRFLDPAGGYYASAAAGKGGDAAVPLRLKEEADGAEPAAASVAAMNLLRLAQMTDDPALRRRGEACLNAALGPTGPAAGAAEHPSAMPAMLCALDFALGKPRQIVLAGDPRAADTRLLLREAYRPYLADRVILAADGAAGQAFLAAHAPFFKGLGPLGGKATAYVCQNYACQMPTTDPMRLRSQLAEKPGPPGK